MESDTGLGAVTRLSVLSHALLSCRLGAAALMLLTASAGMALSVTVNPAFVIPGGYGHTLDSSYTNDTNEFIINSATIDVFGSLFQEVHALGNSTQPSLEEMVANEVGLTILAGEIDDGWSAAVDSGGSIVLSNNGIIPDLSYDVWRNTLFNPNEDTLDFRVTLPHQLLELNGLSLQQPFTAEDLSSSTWDPSQYDAIVVRSDSALLSAPNYIGPSVPATIEEGFVGFDGAFGSVAGSSAYYVLLVPGDFAEWTDYAAQHLALDPAGDANGNGRSNFLDYASGQDPEGPDLLPLVEPRDGLLALRRRVDGIDVLATVQYSDDLDEWHPLVEGEHYTLMSNMVDGSMRALVLALIGDQPAERFYRQGFGPAPSRTKVDAIYCLGDSFTKGDSGPPSYPKVLATLSGLPTTNAGTNGEKANEMKERYLALSDDLRSQSPVIWEQMALNYTNPENQPAVTVAAYQAMDAGILQAHDIKVFVVPANRIPYSLPNDEVGSSTPGFISGITTLHTETQDAINAAFSPAVVADMQDWMTNPRRYTPVDSDDETDQNAFRIPRSLKNDDALPGNGTHLNTAGHAWAASVIWHTLNRQIDPGYYDLADDCFLCLRMDEFSAATTFLDSAGTRDAVLSDAAGISRIAGKFGKATEFTSEGGVRAEISHDPAMDFSGDWAISVWVRPEADGEIIFDKFSSGGFLLQTNPTNTIQFVVDSGMVMVSQPYTPGAWHHVYAYFDDTADEIGVSVNGAEATTATLGGVGWGAFVPLKIGASQSNGTPYGGGIQQLAMWNRLLTRGERSVIYNFGAGRRIPGL